MYKNEAITVIQNEKTTCIVTDKNLIDFFAINEMQYNLTFTREYLIEKYGEQADFCLDFLLNNSLAVKDEVKLLPIKQIYFLPMQKRFMIHWDLIFLVYICHIRLSYSMQIK